MALSTTVSRLAYMASVVVDGEQFKTYPQTFASQVIQMFVEILTVFHDFSIRRRPRRLWQQLCWTRRGCRLGRWPSSSS